MDTSLTEREPLDDIKLVETRVGIVLVVNCNVVDDLWRINHFEKLVDAECGCIFIGACQLDHLIHDTLEATCVARAIWYLDAYTVFDTDGTSDNLTRAASELHRRGNRTYAAPSKVFEV